MTDPGRMIRSHPIASRAAKPCARIRCAAISVPVRPSPACRRRPAPPLDALGAGALVTSLQSRLPGHGCPVKALRSRLPSHSPPVTAP